MYLDYFSLSSAPFSIVPDPNFLYLTEKHQEALAHLQYSTAQKGGFVLLTGEIGTGKTTLCRHFLKSVPEQYQTAFIFNPKISAAELLETICDEFGIARSGGTNSIKQLTDRINGHLLEIHASGRNALLIIDEAQNLSLDVLEQVRLLTNLETTEHKLLQIILIGQPQLKALLRSEELRQLAQRIVARYHLEPLSAPETERYIKHRLLTSGCTREAADALFPAAALGAIQQSTQGVPRLINVLCDRALLGAYVENTRAVSRRIVRNAVRESLGDEPSAPRSPHWRLAAIGAGLAAIASASGTLAPSLPVLASAVAKHVPARSALVATAVATAPAPAATAAPWSAAGTEPAAYQALLKRWDVAVEPGESTPGDACSAAYRQRLRCFSASHRSWQQFLQFNLPAVLTLRDVDQHEFHATIESISGDQAKLTIDGKNIALRLSQLAFYWTGKFTLIWRPPSGYLSDGELRQKSLVELMKAPPPWLLRQLADQDKGLPLRRQIANFQRNSGIQSDGVIGLQTLVMLSRGAGNDPVLQAEE